MMCKIFKHLLKSTGYSILGLKSAFKSELAFKLEIYLTIFILPLAYYMASNKIELILLVLSWFIVILMELVNTAIESVVDRISLDKHELSKKAKDVGSAGVLVAIILFVFVWVVIII